MGFREEKRGKLVVFSLHRRTRREEHRWRLGTRRCDTHTHSSDSRGGGGHTQYARRFVPKTRHLRLATSYTPLRRTQLVGPATNPRVTHKPPGTVLVSYPNHTRWQLNHCSDHKVGRCCDERHAKHSTRLHSATAPCALPREMEAGTGWQAASVSIFCRGLLGFQSGKWVTCVTWSTGMITGGQWHQTC